MESKDLSIVFCWFVFLSVVLDMRLIFQTVIDLRVYWTLRD